MQVMQTMQNMQNNNKTEFVCAVGEKLLAARRKKGLTQREAAKAVGTSQSCISAIEHGRKQGSLNIVVELIKLYGVSYEAVLGASENAEPLSDKADIRINDGGGLSLINALTEKSALKGLDKQLSDEMKVFEYLLFREVYEQNPHNSDKLFKLSSDEAKALFERFFPQQAKKLSQAYRVKPSAAVKLELPVERNAELRAFIKECEALLNACKN
ncbi:helix-turn-helix transcriptional regulator [Ruminococcus sp.]|uniref:helix-turn-helix domain-containing protein n=1 Tax=Ruminococcus sp. TaxID=41978 RepID=UPI0025FDD931|nr:helix-turn-helix transcriptional regulator [Ruminococcus sp.]